MAAYVQILLALLYVVTAQGHHFNPFGIDFDLRHYNKPKKDTDSRYTSSSVIDLPNDDTYSYKYEKMHDHYFTDGNGFNKAFDPYFGYPDFFKRPNFDNMPLPFGLPNIENKYPGKYPPTANKDVDTKPPVEKIDNNHFSSIESSDTKKNSDKAVDTVNEEVSSPSYGKQTLEESKDKSKQFDDIPPKTNEVKDDIPATSVITKNFTLSAKKDYLLVDNNGNNAYILHENNPNNIVANNDQLNLINALHVPVTSNKNVVQQPNNNNQYYQYPNGQLVNNQPNGNNVMYVPLVSNTNNQQAPNNQVYQVLNGQPTSVNVPFTGNGINPNAYSNYFINTPQNNPVPNNYNPSYIYIYANGQLTQIPAFIISPQQNVPLQNGYNGIFTPSGPNYGVLNGNNQIPIQLPLTSSGVSSNQQTDIALQNPQANINLGSFNVQNGNSQPNLFPNYNNAGFNNNPGVQSNTGYPIYSNGNNNQQLSPTPQKDTNVAGSPQNDIPAQYDAPKISQNTPETPVENKNYIGAQSAVMFSDFKDKDDSKEIDERYHEKDVKEKKKAEVKDH